MNKLDPRESKLFGGLFILSGLLLLFVPGTYLTTILLVVYGLVSIFHPGILFPSKEVLEARREKLRARALESSARPLSWYLSPLVIVPCAGLLAYFLFLLFVQ